MSASGRRTAASVRQVGEDELAPVLDALVALEAALFDDPWDAAALTELVAGWGRRLRVATDERDAVVGYVLTQDLGDFVDLLRIGVAPTAQRRGVATALLAAVDAGADGQRVLLEVSEANAPARAFYARHDFTEIDRRPGYYPDGSAALVLERAARTAVVDPAADQRRMDP